MRTYGGNTCYGYCSEWPRANPNKCYCPKRGIKARERQEAKRSLVEPPVDEELEQRQDDMERAWLCHSYGVCDSCHGGDA